MMKLVSSGNGWNLYMFSDSRHTLYVYDRYIHNKLEFIRISKASWDGKCTSDRVTMSRENFLNLIPELENRGLVIC